MSRRNSAIRVVIVAVMLSLPAAAATAGDDLVINGRFDDDLAGWEVVRPAQAAWSATDVENLPFSGSVLLATDTSGFVRETLLRQCIGPLGGVYRLRAFGRVVAGSAPGRLVVASQQWQSLATCSSGTGGIPSPSVDADFASSVTWTSVTHEFAVEPGAYLRIELAIVKDSAGGSIGGRLDNVSLVQVGETPVFTDGFEFMRERCGAPADGAPPPASPAACPP